MARTSNRHGDKKGHWPSSSSARVVGPVKAFSPKGLVNAPAQKSVGYTADVSCHRVVNKSGKVNVRATTTGRTVEGSKITATNWQAFANAGHIRSNAAFTATTFEPPVKVDPDFRGYPIQVSRNVVLTPDGKFVKGTATRTQKRLAKPSRV